MPPRPGPAARSGALARVAGAVALIFCVFLAQGVRAQDNTLELALKATYLVKFAQFVEWPSTAFDGPAGPLTLCIVGQPLLGLADRAAAGQAVGQHPLAVRHIATVAQSAGCHVLYADGSAEGLDALRAVPALTVTDLPEGAGRKGIVNFVTVANHLRFQIDDRAADAAGLKISSQLLALAVNPNPR
jgi:hypothetical protein